MGNFSLFRKKIALALFIVLGAISARAETQDRDRCSGLLTAKSAAVKNYEYPASVDPQVNPDGYYMFGLESEYSLDQMSERLFNFYAPAEELLPRAAWIALAPLDRAAWVQTNWDRLFPGGPKKPSHLVKIAGDERLPAYLISDETGNVELVSKPFDTYEEYLSFAAMVERDLGPGYLQASISIPSALVYQSEQLTDGYVGYRLFLGTFDELSKFAESYEKHRENPKFIPVKAATHKYLGPMNANRANFLRRLVHLNRVGDFNKDVLDRVSGRNSSHKYTSQVAYRPDVIRKFARFLNEVRDCVKNFACLKRRIDRERFFLGQDLKSFSRFEPARPLDLIADFDLLSEPVQKFLRTAFPGPDMAIPEIREDLASEHLMGETFRNFAYPLQDWSSWLEPIGFSTSSPEYHRVKSAQHEYVERLKRIAAEASDGKIDVAAGADQVRIAMAKFVHDSRLREAFESWLVHTFPHEAKAPTPIWK